MIRTWHALRQWIQDQEHSELETGRPPALSPAQRHAIAVLVPDAAPRPNSASGASVQGSPPAPAPKAGPEVDPDFDTETDWVSKLNLYGQAQGPTYEMPKWEEHERVLTPKTSPKYQIYCTVFSLNASFPNETYGFVRGKAPWFSNKKSAKRYAAMCAMRCINDTLSTPTSHRSTPKHPAPEVQDPENTNGAPLKQPDSRALAPCGPDTGRSAPLSARKKPKLEGEEPDAPTQVRALCAELGLIPPRFEVSPHGDDTSSYDARPVFSDDFIEKVPQGLGVVERMLTKKAAKEASAEQVLQWLKQIEKERNRELMGLCCC